MQLSQTKAIWAYSTYNKTSKKSIGHQYKWENCCKIPIRFYGQIKNNIPIIIFILNKICSSVI